MNTKISPPAGTDTIYRGKRIIRHELPTKRLNFPEDPAFTVRKIRDVNRVSGRTKVRTIHIPNPPMKVLQKDFLAYVEDLFNTSIWFRRKCRNAVGCVRGESTFSGVSRHAQNRYFFLLDLKHAFDHVCGDRLAHVLSKMGYWAEDPPWRKELYGFLKKYCLSDDTDGLMLGASSSNMLFNIYAEVYIDRPLQKFLEKHDIVYTRYLDDLTFSKKKTVITKKERTFIRNVIRGAGFSPNDQKSKKLDLKVAPIVINGVGLEWNPDDMSVYAGARMFLPARFLGRVEGVIHLVEQKCCDMTILNGLMGQIIQKSSFCGRTERETRILEKYRSLQNRERTRKLLRGIAPREPRDSA